jgi:GTPase SAR1 family protein
MAELYNIGVLDAQGVGKTALVLQYFTNSFMETIGASIVSITALVLMILS